MSYQGTCFQSCCFSGLTPCHIKHIMIELCKCIAQTMFQLPRLHTVRDLLPHRLAGPSEQVSVIQRLLVGGMKVGPLEIVMIVQCWSEHFLGPHFSTAQNLSFIVLL